MNAHGTGEGGGTPRESGRGSRRWFHLLLRLYPPDFRDEMGDDLVSAYEERARVARAAGRVALAGVWLRALADSLRNGLAERLNPAAAWRRSGNWGRDAEIALRRLVRAPVFSLAMIGTLTVGLGAFSVVYAVVHQVLLAPLPYPDADDLHFVWRDYRAFFDLDRGWMAGTDVVELQKAGGAIAQAVGMRHTLRVLSDDAGTRPTVISTMVSTPNLFDVLGAKPLLGRYFAPDESGPGKARVIVLTYGLWTRMGADRAIIGRSIRLNNEPFTVIGVTPEDFEFVGHASLGSPQPDEAFITFSFDLSTTRPNAGSFGTLLRARHGSTPVQVRQAVNAVGRLVDRRDFRARGLVFYPVALKPDLVAKVRPALTIVGLAGVFLVLVLLVNLASILFVRAVQREKEFAVSRALGANGVAVMRATLLEGATLGLIGGAGGAVAAIWGTRVFVSMAPDDLPRLGTIALTWPIGLTIALLGAVLGLIAAAAPSLWAARARLSSLLSASAVRGGGGHGRVRRVMVVVQVALSLVLLCAGGLVVRSFGAILRADPGFATAGILTLRVPFTGEITEADADAKQRAIVGALAAIPGVTSVGATSALPLSAGADQSTLAFPGAPGNTGKPDADRPLVDYLAIRPGFFETMGVRFLEGHPFEPEAPAGAREVVIDQHVAEQFYPGRSALGAWMIFNGDSLSVIGVIRQPRLYTVYADDRPQIWLRNAGDFGRGTLYYALRTTRDPTSLIAEARTAIARVDPTLAISEARSMDQIVGASLAQQRTSAVMIAGFSLGALLLAAMGLFGVVSGTVTRRRNELALRLALGADHAHVVRLVVGEGALLVALGLVIGAPGVWAGGRVVRKILIDVSPWDPRTLAGVAAGLTVVALLTCWIPARRVLGIDPAQALREE